MPRLDWHIHKKQHDKDTNSLLVIHSPNYSDWEVITLFYSAMHHVDAAICKIRSTGIQIPEPIDHKHRRKIVAKHLGRVATEYGMLESISQWARYQEVAISNEIVDAAKSLYSDVISYLRNYVP